MLDDNKASKLISKSLRIRLSEKEAQQVEDKLESCEQTQKFAALSKAIQESVAGNLAVSKMGVTKSNAGGLTSEAKLRLKGSVLSAVEEKNSLSQAGLISGSSVEIGKTVSHTPEFDSGLEEYRKITNRFHLMRVLGEGGLGKVWLARDEQLNRRVAIKELKSESSVSPNARLRFHREAEITGHLEHPNVVPLYQYGINQATEEPFYAMRFVGKRTLTDAISEHHDRVAAGFDCSINTHRLLSVFLDICQAIAYAHSRGVVHRDLKPNNVALDNFGQVIVLDWGLAKIMEDSELAMKVNLSVDIASSSTLIQTMDGEVIGTPRFMSPEQASGRLDEVDQKSDIYGLGAILFAMLTGKAPHDQELSESADLDSVLKTIAESETPRPLDVYSCVPQELDAICAKAMAKKRHLRFESVQDLADAVEAWMAGQNEKKAGYDNLRMEGRELRAELQSYAHNLERNVRFAAGLPPIEQLMQVTSDQEISVWRERLSSIFEGLLQANPDYQNIAYLRFDEDSYTELVRVERIGNDSHKIRVVPKSRLTTATPNDFHQRVIHKLPEEVLTSLVCNPMCSPDARNCNRVGLLSAVPVYNDQTEELFGLVLINCDMQKLLRRQMERRLNAGEVIVACDTFNILMRTKQGQFCDESLSATVRDAAPEFLPVVDYLQDNLDFIDNTNCDIYGGRLWFDSNKNGVMYMLKSNSS
ncbi:MAG: serine/threonine-protein kinase [Planctomycetota bacterium]